MAKNFALLKKSDFWKVNIWDSFYRFSLVCTFQGELLGQTEFIRQIIKIFNFSVNFCCATHQSSRDEQCSVAKNSAVRVQSVIQPKSQFKPSGDLKSGLVWILNGQKEVGLQIV